MTGDGGEATAPQAIRWFVFGTRAEGESSDDFHARWDERFEGLAANPRCRTAIRRLELYRRLPDPADPGATVHGMGNRHDGVAVLTFADLADLEAVRAAGDGAAAADDGAWVVTRQPDVIVGPAGGDPAAPIVFFCLLRRQAGWALDAFHDHWLHHHGGILRDNPSLADPLRGYEQHHGIGGPDARFDGLTQQWFASLADRDRGLASAAHRELEAPDVAAFLDPVEMYWVLTERGPVLIG